MRSRQSAQQRLVPLLLVISAAVTVTLAGQAGPTPRAAPLSTFDPMERSIEDLQRAMQAHEITSRQLVDI